MNRYYTAAIDSIIMLLLITAVVTNNFILAIIPLLTAWLAIASAIVLIFKPTAITLNLPFIYHITYDLAFIGLLLIGGYLLTGICYIIVPVVIYNIIKQSQETK